MPETYPTDAALASLSGTTDAEQDVPYVPIGESPYHASFYRMQYRLLDVARRAGDLRVYKDGDLTFGVRPGRLLDGDAPVDYPGSEGNNLTNNQVNAVYLDAAGGLHVSTGGFPDPSDVPHVPLATIATAAGAYGHADITDYRGRAMLGPCSGLSASAAGAAGAFFAGTDISAAEAETLTDGANADALHVHAAGGLADGCVTDTKIAPDAGVARSKLATDTLAVLGVSLTADCRNVDGTPLTSPGSPGRFGIAAGGWDDGSIELRGQSARNGTETDTLLFEFALPPEYVPGGDARVVVHARYDASGGGTIATRGLACQAYALPATGQAGADLCQTAASDLSASYADHAFVLDAAALSPGDRLSVLVRATIQETADAGTVLAAIGRIEIRADVRG